MKKITAPIASRTLWLKFLQNKKFYWKSVGGNCEKCIHTVRERVDEENFGAHNCEKRQRPISIKQRK